MRETLDIENIGFAPPDADMKRVFPTLYLRGNAIYMKSDFCDAAGLLSMSICGVVEMFQRCSIGFMSREYKGGGGENENGSERYFD